MYMHERFSFCIVLLIKTWKSWEVWEAPSGCIGEKKTHHDDVGRPMLVGLPDPQIASITPEELCKVC